MAVGPEMRPSACYQLGVTKALLVLGLCAGAAACGTTTTARLHLPELQTVAHVDLNRYCGTWYEIATIPQGFQRGCTASTATYAIRDDGEIEVLNRCRQGSFDGPERFVRGRARIVDRATNAKLTVSFFRPFWGDYWVIDLGPDYDYAVVGHPTRDYLWILSRTPTMAPAAYDAIVGRIAAKGYETQRLVRTLQPTPKPARP
jgi:apolipoprotein D and lipocalin family protein